MRLHPHSSYVFHFVVVFLVAFLFLFFFVSQTLIYASPRLPSVTWGCIAPILLVHIAALATLGTLIMGKHAHFRKLGRAMSLGNVEYEQLISFINFFFLKHLRGLNSEFKYLRIYPKAPSCNTPEETTIMDKLFGTIQRFIFQLTFYHIFYVLLQPSPPRNLLLLGGNQVKTVCRTESGPCYAQQWLEGLGGRGGTWSPTNVYWNEIKASFRKGFVHDCSMYFELDQPTNLFSVLPSSSWSFIPVAEITFLLNSVTSQENN